MRDKKCNYCGNTKFWKLSDGRYRCKECRKDSYFKASSYWSKSRISPYYKGKLLEYFCLGVPAYRLRLHLPLTLSTIERFYHLVRLSIFKSETEKSILLSGELEMDEAYFGGKRKALKKEVWFRGRIVWTSFIFDKQKQAVFGIYKRNGCVLTFPVPDRKAENLRPLIDKHIKDGGVYYTDENTAYASLSLKGKHITISKDVISRAPKGKHTINGIEGFWSYAKHWLYQYRGVPKQHFHLYLKEIEWRFNNRDKDLIKLARGLLNQQY